MSRTEASKEYTRGSSPIYLIQTPKGEMGISRQKLYDRLQVQHVIRIRNNEYPTVKPGDMLTHFGLGISYEEGTAALLRIIRNGEFGFTTHRVKDPLLSLENTYKAEIVECLPHLTLSAIKEGSYPYLFSGNIIGDIRDLNSLVRVLIGRYERSVTEIPREKLIATFGISMRRIRILEPIPSLKLK